MVEAQDLKIVLDKYGESNKNIQVIGGFVVEALAQEVLGGGVRAHEDVDLVDLKFVDNEDKNFITEKVGEIKVHRVSPHRLFGGIILKDELTSGRLKRRYSLEDVEFDGVSPVCVLVTKLAFPYPRPKDELDVRVLQECGESMGEFGKWKEELFAIMERQSLSRKKYFDLNQRTLGLDLDLV